MRTSDRKPVIALIAALLVLFPAATSAHDGKHVLFVSPGFAAKGFWRTVGDTMRAAADALGFHLTVVSGERKWPVMVSRGLAAIDKFDPDYVILVNEHQQAPKLMEKAAVAGIPMLLLLNGLTPEQERVLGGPRQKFKNWLGTLTPDNEIAGFEMARSLAEAGGRLGLGNGPMRVLTLAGDFKTPASIDRLAGLDRALAGVDTLTEVRRMTVNWSEAEAYKRTRIFLTSQDIDAVWAANDPIAMGAIRALRETGRQPGKDVVVTGLNWSPEAIDLVQKGEMTLTHGGHFLAGAWAMVLLHDYDRGRDFADISTRLRFPMSAIDSGNAGVYDETFGDQDWSKIDFRKFSRVETPTLERYPFDLEHLLASVHGN